MTDNHPITPPKHLLSHWEEVINYGYTPNRIEEMLTEAARWGADQELEACKVYLAGTPYPSWAIDLHFARRPKPPSIKQQALRILAENGKTLDGRIELEPEDIPIILSAIQSIPEK